MPPQETMRCLNCGYDLHGLPESRCPECGRAFDPNNAGTFDDGTRPLWWRIWAKPPRLWSMCFAVGYLLWWIHAASDGLTFGDVFMWPCLLLIVMVIPGIDYLARCVACATARGRAIGKYRRPARDRWRWVVTPLCLALAISIPIAGNWPLQIGFCFSRAEFEDRARGLISGTLTSPGPQWVGLYYVESITQPRPGVVRFQLGTDWDHYGICYDPNAPAWQTHSLAPDWFFAVWEY
jgi:hypothetical protein